MKEQLKRQLAENISKVSDLNSETVFNLLEKPKNPSFGDLAFPCFQIAKSLKTDPKSAAEILKDKLQLPESFSEVSQAGPFLNFKFVKEKFIENVVGAALEPPVAANNKTVIVEYSSPNIAKPFHVGHLRTTLIGNCLARVYKELGYQTISINHLGDWGTQFGFVWAGCELWGKPETPSVKSLVELYKKATSLREDQEKNGIKDGEQDVNEMARSYFVDLEEGKDYAVDFWKMCLEVSLEYLKAAYDRLNVSFDHYTGESFYSDKLESTQKALEKAGLLKESKGALGVDLGEKLGFARTYTPDGRSLYLARDIATVFYREKEFNFDKLLYVVGIPQTLHFEQLIEILKKLENKSVDKIEHVGFGHVMGMKTRGEGGVIELDEFLDEAYERALTAYHEQVSKRPEGVDDKLVAKNVSLAAIVFSNLNKSRIKDVHFSWEHALAFQGDSGPYVLYAYARINSIKERAKVAGLEQSFDAKLLVEDSAYQLVSIIDEFESTLKLVVRDNEPAHLTSYLLELAKAVSKAYQDLKVVDEDKELAESRLKLFGKAQEILGKGIELLGLNVLDRM